MYIKSANKMSYTPKRLGVTKKYIENVSLESLWKSQKSTQTRVNMLIYAIVHHDVRWC